MLTYRLATWDDEEELRKMRIACGELDVSFPFPFFPFE